MNKIKQFIKRRGIFVLMLLAGLYYGATALWGLTNTLLYYHEAVTLPATVRDVRQRPFESYSEALRYGNLPWQGEIAYRPILTFVMPAGIPIRAYTAPDWDNTDYRSGEQIEIITHPHDPNQAHVNKWKFLWGADCMLLALATLLGLPAWFVLFPRKRRAAGRRTAPRPAQQHKPRPQAQPQPRRAIEPEQPTFTLSADDQPQPTKKTRAPRKKKEADPDAPKKPRAPRKKKEVDPNAPPKPRKPRKKKTEQ